MRCYEIRDVLTEFIEGSLPPEQTREVVDHIARCKACERDVRQMEALIGALHSLPQLDPPSRLRPSVSDALASAAHEQSARAAPLRRRYMWLGGALGAAAAAAVFIGIVLGIRPAFLGRDRPQHVASLDMAEEEAPDALPGRGIPLPESSPVEVQSEQGLDEPPAPTDESAAALAQDDADFADVQGLGLEGELVEESPAADRIRARAETLLKNIRRRSRSPNGDLLAPASPGAAMGPEAAAPGESAKPAAVPERPLRALVPPEAGDAAVDRMAPTTSAAPRPPSALRRGPWDEARGVRIPERARTPTPTEEEEGVADGGAGLKAAFDRPGEYSAARTMVARGPSPATTTRMQFGMTGADVEVTVRGASRLHAGRPGQLIVSLHANREVEDARVRLAAPMGVRLGEAYSSGLVFTGKLAKDATKTIAVPIVPEQSGTKMFRAEVTRAGRQPPISLADVAIPVDPPLAKAAAAGALGATQFTLAFQDIDLHLALTQAAAEAKTKVEIDSRVPHDKITYSAAKKPIAEIMQQLARKGGCQAALKENVWHVAPRPGGE